MTQFKVGDRVRVKNDDALIRHNEEGIVGGDDLGKIVVQFPDGIWLSYLLASLEDASDPISSAMPILYMLLVDGMEIIWSRHNTLEEARKAGNDLLVAGNSDKGATIFKAVEYGQLPERAIEWRKIE